MNWSSHRLTASLVALIVALAVVTTAFATVNFGHNAPYPGSNNYPPGSTPDGGWLAGYGGSGGSFTASGEYVEWNQGAVDWIIANAPGAWGPNEFQVAMVFHSFFLGTQTCSNTDATSAWGNFPNWYYRVKSTCGGRQNEVRIYAQTPSALVAGQAYNAQATFQDYDTTSCNEINIDNYQEDTQWGNGVYKDNMAKFYERAGLVQDTSCP